MIIVIDRKFILSSTLTNAFEIFVFLEAVLALQTLRNFGNLFPVVVVVAVLVLAFVVVVLFSKDLRYHVRKYPTCALVRSNCVLAHGILRTYLRCRLAFINILKKKKKRI